MMNVGPVSQRLDIGVAAPYGEAASDFVALLRFTHGGNESLCLPKRLYSPGDGVQVVSVQDCVQLGFQGGKLFKVFESSSASLPVGGLPVS